jgi:hypothetical protein
MENMGNTYFHLESFKDDFEYVGVNENFILK